MIQRIVGVVVVVLVLGGLIAYSQYRPEPDHVSGFVEADEIRLGSRVGGRVQRVLVEEGQHVEQGEVLVELEPFDLLQRKNEAKNNLAALEAAYQRLASGLRPEEVAQAQARLEQAEARLKLLKAGPRAQEVEAAIGRLQYAEAELTLATQNYDRRKDAFDQNAINREVLDTASEQMQAAQAMVVVRREELSQLQAGSRDEEIQEAEAKVEEARQAARLAAAGYRKEEVEQAQAARDAAQAAVEAIIEQEKELTIKSPVAGVIEALDLQPGDLVAAGAPVLSLLDEHNLWVRVYIPENRVALQVGQKLWVTVDSLGDQKFQGEIVFISRQAEFTPNNVQTPEERSKQVFRVKVALAENLDKIRPGMTADVSLEPVQ